MEIILVLVVAGMLYLVMNNFLGVLKSNKKFLYEFDQILNDNLSISIKRDNLKEYDFSFIYDGTTYIFKVLKCPKDGELVINNKTTWQINLGMKLGKAPKSKIIIKNIKEFMSFEKENTKKICLIYKDCYSIKRWVNESEMVFVKKSDDCFGINFLKYNEFEDFITDLKKSKTNKNNDAI